MNKRGVLFIVNLFGFSILAHTSLLILVCVMGDSGSHYKSSTLGFMYFVIALHVWLSPGSSRCSCLDLDHTRVAYLANE